VDGYISPDNKEQAVSVLENIDAKSLFNDINDAEKEFKRIVQSAPQNIAGAKKLQLEAKKQASDFLNNFYGDLTLSKYIRASLFGKLLKISKISQRIDMHKISVRDK
jgi:hypothetical protein